MDRRFHDFDVLAKNLAGGLSRREALLRLGGGLAGALLASIGLRPASGQSPSGTGIIGCSPAGLDSCLKNEVLACDQAVEACVTRSADLFEEGAIQCGEKKEVEQQLRCLEKEAEEAQQRLKACDKLEDQCRFKERRCRERFGCPSGRTCVGGVCVP